MLNDSVEQLYRKKGREFGMGVNVLEASGLKTWHLCFQPWQNSADLSYQGEYLQSWLQNCFERQNYPFDIGSFRGNQNARHKIRKGREVWIDEPNLAFPLQVRGSSYCGYWGAGQLGGLEVRSGDTRRALGNCRGPERQNHGLGWARSWRGGGRKRRALHLKWLLQRSTEVETTKLHLKATAKDKILGHLTALKTQKLWQMPT